MRKKISLLLFFVVVLANAQNHYYYKGKNQPIVVDTQKLNIFVSENFQINQLIGLSKFNFKNYNDENSNSRWGTLTFLAPLSILEYNQTIAQIKSMTSVLGVGAHFVSASNETVGTSIFFMFN